ncbi:MAG: serine/threonine-protein kinase [Myxococcota bacterium]
MSEPGAELAHDPEAETETKSPGYRTSLVAPTDAAVGPSRHRRAVPGTPSGTRIGRYLLLERIGRGGMGTVFAAYDEQLDRKVAVKILLDKYPGQESLLRFRREAQAMARLSHPNVVTVHEVGESRGELFLAMEFLRGETLDVWLRRRPTWTEVLEVFIEAGRGLWAAHEADLVHRDLKPQNIMRTHAGMVKVLDFGLVRAADEEQQTEPDREYGPDSVLSSSITRRGAILGTPAYMSPEQLHGDTIDARSDQFSFCVALYEGLYGERPYAGTELPTLLESLGRNAVRPPPEGTEVPRAIHQALLRGLKTDPAKRWPSMAALLEALAWTPSRRRTRWGLGVGGVGALGLVGGVMLMGSPQAEERPCTGAQRHLAGIWDEARRIEVEDALRGTGASYAKETWRRTKRALDQYARGWVESHTEACIATAVRAEQSPQMLDRRMGCLHRAALGLHATVDTLADADPELVRRTHDLVEGLPPLSRCSDIHTLAADVAPPSPQEADAVEGAQRQLARADSLVRAGRYPAAREALEAAKTALAGVDDPPIRSELALLRSTTLVKLGKYDAAHHAAVEALVTALRWNQRDVLVQVLRQLMFVLGSKQGKPELAMQHWPMLEELSRGQPHDEASSRHSYANILAEQGKYDEAEAEFRRVISREEHLRGLHDLRLASRYSNLALVLAQQGKYSEAEIELRALVSLEEAVLGPAHPDAALTRGQLARVLVAQDKVQEAQQEARQALRRAQDALGPAHTDVALVRTHLGLILKLQGRYEEAEAEYRAALTIWQDALGPERTKTALARHSLATILNAMGRPKQAEAQIRAAISTLTKTLGDEHPNVAKAAHNLGRILEAQGRLEEAEAQFRRSLSRGEPVLGPEHPDVVTTRTCLASILLDLDRPDEALPLIEQTWARLPSAEIPPLARGQVTFVLARALWAIEGPLRDRTRAQRLADEALRWYAKVEEVHDEDEAEVRRWRDEHRSPRAQGVRPVDPSG